MSDLGRYRLLRRVGTGGMAEVWKAKALGPAGFEKIVAIKRVLPHLGSDLEFIDMFVSEAKLVARLHHPNIVQVFDFGLSEATGGGESPRSEYFIAMEYVPGHNLAEILRRAAAQGAPLTNELALYIGKEAAKALGYAHSETGVDGKAMPIVHRDVSPHNILVSFRGDVKVTDFGIAKVTSALPRTAAGIWKGKIPYMSPEQAQLQPLDHRSDIFSLGLVLYELLTGTRLFSGSSGEEIYEQIKNFTVPNGEAFAALPEPAREILQRALQVDPDQRYATAEAMHADLLETLGTTGTLAARKALGGLMQTLFAEEMQVEVADEEGSSEPSEPETPAEPEAAAAPEDAAKTTVQAAGTSGSPDPAETRLGRTAEWMQAVAEHERDPLILTRVDSPDGTQVDRTRVGEAAGVSDVATPDEAATPAESAPAAEAASALDPVALTQLASAPPGSDSTQISGAPPETGATQIGPPTTPPKAAPIGPEERTDQVRTISTLGEPQTSARRRRLRLKGGTVLIIATGIVVIVGVVLFAAYVLPRF